MHEQGTLIGSGGALVFRAVNNPGDFHEVVVAWQNPYNKKYKNRVYIIYLYIIYVHEFYEDDGVVKSIVGIEPDHDDPLFHAIITLKVLIDVSVPPIHW